MEQSWVGGRWFCLWIHITKSRKGQTLTHLPDQTSQIRRSLVPQRDFAQLPLLEQNIPDQGKESGTEPSSCVCCGLSSGKAEGVPEVGEDGNCAIFYRIAMLACCVMDQWLSLLRRRFPRSHLHYPAWQGWTFMAFCHCNLGDCFRRCLSESGCLTFRVSEK